MTEKPFKTIDEQIAILQSRGLKIDNLEEAKAFLTAHNYYRVSGYSLTLRQNDQFYPTATMQNLIDIYRFDHALRHTLLLLLETIEVKLKSIYAHEFARQYGATSYQDETLFTDVARHKDILTKSEKQRLTSLRHEAYLKHFEDIGELVPIWAYVDFAVAYYNIGRNMAFDMFPRAYKGKNWRVLWKKHALTNSRERTQIWLHTRHQDEAIVPC